MHNGRIIINQLLGEPQGLGGLRLFLTEILSSKSAVLLDRFNFNYTFSSAPGFQRETGTAMPTIDSSSACPGPFRLFSIFMPFGNIFKKE